MAQVSAGKLRSAKNVRANLRRVFDSWGVQVDAARHAGIHAITVAKIISGEIQNPGIETIEAISIALEIPLATLISREPADSDLRIPEKSLNSC